RAIGRWRLRGHEDFLRPPRGPAIPQHMGDQLFAASVAIPCCGVDEVDAQIERAVEGGERVAVSLSAPRPTDGPGTEADFRTFERVFSKRAVMHLQKLAVSLDDAIARSIPA